MDWLIQSIEEHSVLWVVISAGVGGVIGCFIKFIFDQILAYWISERREIMGIVVQYSKPILRAADTLEREINIFVQNVDEKWFDNDEYFRVSILYDFGCYLGWARILEREVVYLDFENERKSRDFNIRFNTVFKAFTSFSYFEEISDRDLIGRSVIPRKVLTAIGELMIERQTDQKRPCRVIEFTTFCREFEKSQEFQRWFRYLADFLSNLKPLATDLRWDRLIVISANLQMLIFFLNPRDIRTKRRQFSNLERIQNPTVKERLLEQIERAGYTQRIPAVHHFNG